MTIVDVAIVGSGPNGLAAAITCARAGARVVVFEAADHLGGATATLTLTGDGSWHDTCSAVHPLATASPFMTSLRLADRGVELLRPEIEYAQAIDPGHSVCAHATVRQTASTLGHDGARYERIMNNVLSHYESFAAAALSDVRGREVIYALGGAIPLGAAGLETWDLLRRASGPAAALLAGVGAHAMTALTHVSATAVALLLGSLAHRGGWVIPRGGSATLSRAMVECARELGVSFVTSARVDSLGDLPRSRTVICDTGPLSSPREVRARRYVRGPAAATLHLVVRGQVGWADPELERAGTIHVGGDARHTGQTLKRINAGRAPAEPFILVSAPGCVDDTRARRGHHTLWAYAQLPHGSRQSPKEAILPVLERYAPGLRGRIVELAERSTARVEADNPNFTGGDIGLGRVNVPRLAGLSSTARGFGVLDPYATRVRGVFRCGADTPPGPGVHGMCGVHAAHRALRHLGQCS